MHIYLYTESSNLLFKKENKNAVYFRNVHQSGLYVLFSGHDRKKKKVPTSP